MTKCNEKIKEIEKEIPNLDANEEVLSFELGDCDFDELKNYMEKKHPEINLILLNPKLAKRKCVESNWYEKFQ